MRLALALLLIGAARHYGWDMFPVEHKGLASKGLGGLAILSLIWVVYSLAHSKILLPVALWWSWEELQVSLCSFAYMRAPWPVEQGQSICSAAVGLDIGAAGIMCIAWLLWWLQAVRSDR
jgi:hypothetical protein